MKTRSFVLSCVLGLALLAGIVGGLFASPGRAEAAVDYITVVVQEGDSLARYRLVYGVSGPAILAVNRIENPDIIYPGQTLIIPILKSFVPSLTTPFFYTAKAGDTITSVAAMFELDPNAITRANRVSALVAGQTYVMPCGPHIYVVKPGDTISGIAARYHVSVDFLGLGENWVYLGQTVFVPIVYDAQAVPIPGWSATGTVTPVPTSAATAAPTAVPTATGKIQVVVQEGDRLGVYVRRYGVSASAILATNPSLWKNPDLIYPGQVLTMPVNVSYTPSRTTPFYYVIQPGDNVVTIAWKFEMSPDVLTWANPAATFAVGTTILVPPGPHLYVVKPGEELRYIAPKFGATVEEMAEWSNIPNPDLLYSGMTLWIPLRLDLAPLPFTP